MKPHDDGNYTESELYGHELTKQFIIAIGFIKGMIACGDINRSRRDEVEDFVLSPLRRASGYELEKVKSTNRSLKKGDEAICIGGEDIEGFIRAGKSYTVIDVRPDEKRIVIIDDRGLEGWYKESRFI